MILMQTNAQHPDFRQLSQALDADLVTRYGAKEVVLTPCHEILEIKQVVLIYLEEQLVGCGAIRVYAPNVMEIKRMYVLPAYRGRGVATTILKALENWAMALKATKCILETGTKQPEAIALYQKWGYQPISSYAPCVDRYNCAFEKELQLSIL